MLTLGKNLCKYGLKHKKTQKNTKKQRSPRLQSLSLVSIQYFYSF